MCVLRFGSLSMAYDSELLVCPAVRWLGVFPFQIEKESVMRHSIQDFNETDLKKVGELMNRPYIIQNRRLMKCVLHMQEICCKVELEALTDNDPEYLAKKFIPKAIANGHWI